MTMRAAVASRASSPSVSAPSAPVRAAPVTPVRAAPVTPVRAPTPTTAVRTPANDNRPHMGGMNVQSRHTMAAAKATNSKLQDVMNKRSQGNVGKQIDSTRPMYQSRDR